MSRHAHLKIAVRAAIDAGGHIAAVASLLGKGRTIVGKWHARNEPDLPTLGDALAIDEVAVVKGLRPEILHRLAAELRCVVFALPDLGAESEAETGALMEAVQEVGDVSGAIRDMLADGIRKQHEREHVVEQIDEAIAKFARLRAIVAGSVRAVDASALRQAQDER